MEYETKEISFKLCGIVLRFASQIPLRVTDALSAFRTEAPPHVTVKVQRGALRLPKNLTGSSFLTESAADDAWCYSAEKAEGTVRPIGVRYRPDFSETEVFIDTAYSEWPRRQICRILQCFPISELLLRYDALLLHASRVETDGRAIIFSGPSGIGKTTQAGLWQQCAGARIVSNDRTIVRKIKDGIFTSGFPVDGSTPASSPEMIPAGAFVVLRQGKETKAEKLSASSAIRYLMEQTASENGDFEKKAALTLLWADILTRCPAYLLTCTPDAGAVRCLKKALTEGGESFGENT